MTLFWDQTGPLLKYEKGILTAESLNPSHAVRWRMSRLEMFKTGCQFLLCSARR